MRLRISSLLVSVLVLVAIGLAYGELTQSEADDGSTPPSIPAAELQTGDHIVYLLAADNNESLVTADKIQSDLKAEIVYTWDAVVEAHQTRPLDAIIMHTSAIEQVDKDWLQTAYQHGVVISAINLTRSELGNLLNNPCIAPDYAEERYSYSIASMRISGGTPDEQAQIISAQLAGCNNESAPIPQGIKSEVHFSTGQGGDILLDENSYHQFTQVLQSYLDRR